MGADEVEEDVETEVPGVEAVVAAAMTGVETEATTKGRIVPAGFRVIYQR